MMVGTFGIVKLVQHKFDIPFHDFIHLIDSFHFIHLIQYKKRHSTNLCSQDYEEAASG